MKKIILLVLMSVYVFSWEVTTHRAIDQTAILNGQATNFYNFLNDSYLGSQTFDDRDSIMFDGYGVTYFYYIRKGEEGGMSDWNLTFNTSPTPIDLIEAGTILEDAQWPNAVSWNGRFNNHFYDPQNGGKGLTFGYGHRTDALTWAWGNATRSNQYDYLHALEYFRQGVCHV